MLISSVSQQIDATNWSVTVTIQNNTRSLKVTKTVVSHHGMKSAVTKAVEDIMLTHALQIATLAAEHIHAEPRPTQS